MKLAMDESPEVMEGHTIDFMAIHQIWASDLRVTEGRLQPATEEARRLRGPAGVKQEATIGDYEAVIVVGMGLSLMVMGQMYATHRLYVHHDAKYQLMSQGAFEQATSEAVFHSGARHIVDTLRQVTAMPILVVPEPLLNSAILKDAHWGDVWTGPHLPLLFDAYRRHLKSTFSLRSAELLEYPEGATKDSYFTHPKYALGLVKFFDGNLREKRREGWEIKDRRHMNKEYGLLICQKIAEWLRSPPTLATGA